MNKAVVTGINGQDGYYVAKLLIENGFEVIGVSKQPALRHTSLSNNISYLSLDISDNEQIDFLIREVKPDYIFNFAGISNEYECLDDPYRCLQTNAFSILRMLEAIRKIKPTCRLLNAGSCEEFGEAESEMLSETTPLLSNRPYGLAKIMARKFIQMYREKFNIFCVQPWLFSHESFLRKDTFFFKKILNFTKIVKINTNNKIEVGNISEQRDWLHASDVAQAALAIISAKTPADYVIGSGLLHSFQDVFTQALLIQGVQGYWEQTGDSKKFITTLGQTIVETNQDNFKYARRKKMICADIKKIQTDLNWSPKYNFNEIIRKVLTENYE